MTNLPPSLTPRHCEPPSFGSEAIPSSPSAHSGSLPCSTS